MVLRVLWLSADYRSRIDAPQIIRKPNLSARCSHVLGWRCHPRRFEKFERFADQE